MGYTARDAMDAARRSAMAEVESAAHALCLAVRQQQRAAAVGDYGMTWQDRVTEASKVCAAAERQAVRCGVPAHEMPF